MAINTKEEIRKSKYKFDNQKKSAAERGISFEFSYDDWIQYWIASGKWENRGPYKDQYCMARHNDIGPYNADNVKIITNSENVLERKNRYQNSKTQIPVTCIGKSFSSLKSAGEYFNLTYQAIAYRVNSKNKKWNDFQYSEVI